MKKNSTSNKSANQKIKCDVNNCIHNNLKDKECDLNEIKVSSDCNEAQAKKQTICDSFECDDCNCNKKE